MHAKLSRINSPTARPNIIFMFLLGFKLFNSDRIYENPFLFFQYVKELNYLRNTYFFIDVLEGSCR